MTSLTDEWNQVRRTVFLDRVRRTVANWLPSSSSSQPAAHGVLFWQRGPRKKNVRTDMSAEELQRLFSGPAEQPLLDRLILRASTVAESASLFIFWQQDSFVGVWRSEDRNKPPDYALGKPDPFICKMLEFTSAELILEDGNRIDVLKHVNALAGPNGDFVRGRACQADLLDLLLLFSLSDAVAQALADSWPKTLVIKTDDGFVSSLPWNPTAPLYSSCQ